MFEQTAALLFAFSVTLGVPLIISFFTPWYHFAFASNSTEYQAWLDINGMKLEIDDTSTRSSWQEMNVEALHQVYFVRDSFHQDFS
jgi:hypothetical protein